MDHQEALDIATAAVQTMQGHVVDVLNVKRPNDMQAAIELSKVVSKLSPVVANLLEYAAVQYLNSVQTWPAGCRWIRQDPDFPDTVLDGMTSPQPGIEFKTWFPLATEITARFKGSQAYVRQNNTRVAMLFWMPEYVIAGQPQIVGVWVGEAIDVAEAREAAYHNPPDYLVMEPEVTATRTRNLQQKNSNGFKFQGNATELRQAEEFAASLGVTSANYSPDPTYQALLRQLAGRFPYRLETNFAKMDRIQLASLEAYKTHILDSTFPRLWPFLADQAV